MKPLAVAGAVSLLAVALGGYLWWELDRILAEALSGR